MPGEKRTRPRPRAGETHSMQTEREANSNKHGGGDGSSERERGRLTGMPGPPGGGNRCTERRGIPGAAWGKRLHTHTHTHTHTHKHTHAHTHTHTRGARPSGSDPHWHRLPEPTPPNPEGRLVSDFSRGRTRWSLLDRQRPRGRPCCISWIHNGCHPSRPIQVPTSSTGHWHKRPPSTARAAAPPAGTGPTDPTGSESDQHLFIRYAPRTHTHTHTKGTTSSPRHTEPSPVKPENWTGRIPAARPATSSPLSPALSQPSPPSRATSRSGTRRRQVEACSASHRTQRPAQTEGHQQRHPIIMERKPSPYRNRRATTGPQLAGEPSRRRPPGQQSPSEGRRPATAGPGPRAAFDHFRMTAGGGRGRLGDG